VEWSFVGALLSRTGSGDLGPNRVVERPKVVYNKATQKYVLWMHIDSSDYGEAKAGVAIGDSVCGKFEYKSSFRPLGFESRDQGVFVDEDNKGYLLTEDRKNGLRIDLLADDYLTVKSATYVWKEKIESPTIIKKNGVYFMFGSKLTGWDANDNVYSTATKLSGPWSGWKTFADSGSNTYQSQTTYVLPVGSGAMYMGDRWVSSNLMRSTYIWLPLKLEGTTASMKNAVNWVVDASSGSMVRDHYAVSTSISKVYANTLPTDIRPRRKHLRRRTRHSYRQRKICRLLGLRVRQSRGLHRRPRRGRRYLLRRTKHRYNAYHAAHQVHKWG